MCMIVKKPLQQSSPQMLLRGCAAGPDGRAFWGRESTALPSYARTGPLVRSGLDLTRLLGQFAPIGRRPPRGSSMPPWCEPPVGS